MSDIKTISHDVSETNGTAAETPWERASSELHQYVDTVHSFTLEGVNALDQSLELDLLSPLLETITKAASVHAGLLDALKEALEKNPESCWQDVLIYRQATNQRVLAPLNARLSTQIAEQVAKRFLKFYSDFQSASTHLPSSQTIPEPPSLYSPAEEDGLWIRLRKSHIRSSRRLVAMRRNVGNAFRKIVGRTPIEAPSPKLVVDLETLLSYHLQVRLHTILSEKFDILHAFLTTCYAAYESAATEWSYDLLEIEQTLAHSQPDLTAFSSWISKQKTGEKEISEKTLHRVISVATAFQANIDKIAQHRQPALQIPESKWQLCTETLLHDFKSSDSFLLGDRSLPDESEQPPASINLVSQAWNAWYKEVGNRLAMNARLHELRDFLLRRQHGLLNAIANASIIPILQSLSSLREVVDRISRETDSLLSTASDAEGHYAVLSQDLQAQHKQLSSHFKSILNDVTHVLRAGQALEKPGLMFWNDLQRFVEGLPEQVNVHELRYNPTTPTDASEHRYAVPFRELIQGALLDPLSNRVSQQARLLQKAVVNTWEETQQVEQMADYNLKAAFAELDDPTEEEQVGEDKEEPAQEDVFDSFNPPLDAAKELIANGLARSSEKLTELAQGLQKPWEALVEHAFAAIQAYSNDVLHDVREEDDMNDGWTNFKMRVSRSVKKLSNSTDQLIERSGEFAKRVIYLGRRQTKQLIKKGQTAVGVVDQSEDQWLATLALASDIDSLHQRLPLVYRRLFSLKPLTDLDLLEGRKLDLAFVKKHYAQWQNSQTGPLLLAMPDGSGRTSFMNVLSDAVFDDANVHAINLTHRVTDTQIFADRIAEALSISLVKPLTIDALEARIIEMKRGETQCIIAIDRFEHFLLCTPGGQATIERILMFMSRTDNLIYWVINIGTHAWHFLEKTMSPSSGFISAYKAANLQRQALEDIILKRHSRSGMNLHFKSTVSTKSFFDFSRPTSEKNAQELHRATFFDRLYKLSGQNILLAILYWLRSVEFDSEKDTLLVNAIEPINFSFLDTLDLQRAFTLKSFLIHGTLTLQEHMRVFKRSQTESTFILESLLNLRIIEPSIPASEEKIHFRIETDQPYRIHPLIAHPVLELLKKRHIIY